MILDRAPAQILTVKLDQVEGAQHGSMVVTPGAEQLEHREAAVVGDDDFAVDQAGAHRQRRDGRGYQRKAPGELVARDR